LDQWEEGVKKRKGFTKQQMDKMLLSRPTRLGLRLTGNISVKHRT